MTHLMSTRTYCDLIVIRQPTEMSYLFTVNSDSLDSSVLVEENVVWDNSGEEDLEDDIVVDGILDEDAMAESFATATADDDADGSTRYFSVLETSSETILGDMELTTDATEQERRVEETGNGDGNEVMLYSVPGDGLYGIQFAEDEQGNLQKYQFRLRYELKKLILFHCNIFIFEGTMSKVS